MVLPDTVAGSSIVFSMKPMTGDPGPGEDPLDLEAINKALAHMSARHNAAPDPELGGLSPDTVHRLIHEAWDHEESPIRFHGDLRPADLAGSRIFRRARCLLAAVHTAGGFRTTPKGNLPRALVARFLADPEMIAGDEFPVLKHQTVINEKTSSHSTSSN